MAAPSPTAAPPNFYESLPAGASAGANGGAKKEESETDDEILKALTGVIRVMNKVQGMRADFKAKITPIKDAVKDLIVNGLKKSPADLDTGDDSQAPPAAAPPKSTDETHAA